MDSRIKTDDKFVIFHVDGGHGKCVMSTAVCRAIHKKFPDRKLIVVSGWDGPYFYNEDIWRFYVMGQMQYFYDDYVKDDTIILRHDVYHSEDHILQRKHLVESWCDMYDLPYDNNKPKIYLNPREIEIANDKIKPNSGKPIMLLQTHGGSPKVQYSKKSWFRDMPINIAQKVVNHFKDKYRILHIRLPEQPTLENVEHIMLPFRELYAVFMMSEKRLFIDSFAQHVSTALDLQSTVLWIGNKPEIFGYEENINILTNAKYIREFNKFSYTDQYDISGQIQQFPYDTVDLFNVDEIINAIEQQK